MAIPENTLDNITRTNVKPNPSIGFTDPRGEFPKKEYFFKPTTNREVVGEVKTSISLGGGHPNLSFDGFLEADEVPSQYGKVQVQETSAGHKFILDDTPGGERIVLKHAKGTGLEFKSDGGINIRSKNNIAVSIDANGLIILEGDLRISSKNLTLDVAGDFDLNVAGNYNMNIAGDKKETIEGSYRSNIKKNRGEVVVGNKSKTVLQAETNTVLGLSTNVIKGDYNLTVGGNSTHAYGGTLKLSAQGEIVNSSPYYSVATADLSLVGAGGTIGGENMIYYGTTAHIDRVNSTSMHATTFHGDLNGTALQANATSSQNYGEAVTSGTAYDYTSSSATNNESFKPTADIMNKVLTNSSRGVREVEIDSKEYIKNKIDRTTKMGGVANRQLNVSEVRAKLKDPAHEANIDFIKTITSDGVLSYKYFNKTPPGIGRAYSGKGTVSFLPQDVNGSIAALGTGKLVSGTQSAFNGFRPDSKYDPMGIAIENLQSINGKTLLGNGIPLSTFLSGPGYATTLGHIATVEERLSLARQLLLQTEVIKLVKNNESKFKDFRIIVAEGVYKKGSNEQLTSGGILDLATTGRAITYELYDEKNKSYPEITYEFAEYIAEYLPGYNKIILQYDNLDPDAGNKIHSQITVIMPEINNEYNIVGGGKPAFELETYFNNKIMSNTDLVEIDPFAVPEINQIAVSRVDSNVIVYELGEIRNKPVNTALERIFVQAARAAKVDKVVITSGKQPGTTGKRTGSTRHDTGMAADLYLQKDGLDITLDTYQGRVIIEKFVRKAVELGVRAGGMSTDYMGNKVMHLDTLGKSLGGGRYDNSVPVAWKSADWFASAIIST
jgi:hypothetical protein